MKKFDFSKGFGNIDPKYISEAEGEWKEKKNVWIASFWSKLAAACVILALISTVLSNPKVQAAIKNLALSIGETLGLQKEIESYTEVLNMSQIDQGITVNIKEVVLDEGVYCSGCMQKLIIPKRMSRRKLRVFHPLRIRELHLIWTKPQ